MIKRILTYYAERLDEYLSTIHHQPEGIAEVGFIGNSGETLPNKMVVSLISIERETSGGIVPQIQRSEGGFVKSMPPLMLNLNVVIAAVYDERRYAESLSVLSDTLRFIQSMPAFAVDGERYTIELMTVHSQELNNVWTTLGGQYYPSVVCKIRKLTITSGDISGSSGTAEKAVVETK